VNRNPVPKERQERIAYITFRLGCGWTLPEIAKEIHVSYPSFWMWVEKWAPHLHNWFVRNGERRKASTHYTAWRNTVAPEGYIKHHIIPAEYTSNARTNNQLSNMEFLTQSEHLKLHREDKNAERVRIVREGLKMGKSRKQIALDLGICYGSLWTWLLSHGDEIEGVIL
jgi:transposase-like protein